MAHLQSYKYSLVQSSSNLYLIMLLTINSLHMLSNFQKDYFAVALHDKFTLH